MKKYLLILLETGFIDGFEDNFFYKKISYNDTEKFIYEIINDFGLHIRKDGIFWSCIKNKTTGISEDLNVAILKCLSSLAKPSSHDQNKNTLCV